MADREKVIKGLEGIYRCISPVNHTCGDCPYQDNHVECERRVVSDALELLKENDIELERIHRNICTYINGGCSTDTEADKEYICSQIGRIFEGKPVLLDEEVKQDADD